MRLFLILITSIIVFIFFLFPVTDFDIWFHLAGGKFMIENWQFPKTEIFSYTAHGNPWYINSFGFDALSYSVFKFWGLDGLNILKAIISLLIFLLIIFYLNKRKGLNLFSSLFVVLALFSIREGFSLRPHTFSYLIFVVFLILLFKYRESKNYKLIFFLCLTQFIWVNFHSSFIWGIAFCGLFLVSETFLNRKIEKKDLVLAGSVFLVSLLHIFYGPNYFLRIFKASFGLSKSPIRELLPPTPETFMSLMGFILFSLFLVIYFSYKEKRFDILLISTFLSLIALTNARFLRDLVLFLCLVAPPYFPKIPKAKIKKISSIKMPRTAQSVFYFVILFSLFLWAKNTPLGIGLGLERFTYPVKAVEFIKNERLLEKSNGQLYNTYNFGGYLTWTIFPHKIFIDGRMQLYSGEIFDNYWSNFEGGDIWRNNVEKYNITLALMTLPHTDGKTVYNDSSLMFPKKEWGLVYYDDVSMIYVKRMDSLKDLVEKYEYKIINPQAMDFGYLEKTIKNQEDFEMALEEIKRGLELNPESYRLHFTLSYLYNLGGAKKEMLDELNKTLEINPYFKPARDILDQYSFPAY